MSLRPTTGHPYQELAADLAAKIQAGELGPDERLKPIRVLAQEYRTTIATTQRAIQHLVQTGYVRSVPNVGSFVLADTGDRKRLTVTAADVDERVDRLQAALEALEERVRSIESREA